MEVNVTRLLFCAPCGVINAVSDAHVLINALWASTGAFLNHFSIDAKASFWNKSKSYSAGS